MGKELLNESSQVWPKDSMYRDKNGKLVNGELRYPHGMDGKKLEEILIQQTSQHGNPVPQLKFNMGENDETLFYTTGKYVYSKENGHFYDMTDKEDLNNFLLEAEEITKHSYLIKRIALKYGFLFDKNLPAVMPDGNPSIKEIIKRVQSIASESYYTESFNSTGKIDFMFPFNMIPTMQGNEDIKAVQGVIRLSNHTLNSNEWFVRNHGRFGISVIIGEDATANKKPFEFVDNFLGEIWCYHIPVVDEKIEKRLFDFFDKLCNKNGKGKNIILTEEMADDIFGPNKTIITNQNNVNTKLINKKDINTERTMVHNNNLARIKAEKEKIEAEKDAEFEKITNDEITDMVFNDEEKLNQFDQTGEVDLEINGEMVNIHNNTLTRQNGKQYTLKETKFVITKDDIRTMVYECINNLIKQLL